MLKVFASLFLVIASCFSYASGTHIGSVTLAQPFPLQSADLIDGQVEFGHSFSSVEQLCVKPSYESSHTWMTTLNVYDDSNNSVFNSFYNNNIEYCRAVQTDELRNTLMSGKFSIDVKPQTWGLQSLTVTIVGTADTVAGETVTLDASEHTMSGYGGSYLSHFVEPGTTYSIQVMENDSVYNAGGDKFANVGVAYIDKSGEKTISIANDSVSYITSTGELQFFLVGDGQNHSGKISINIQRVNID
ncbi:hypothetical protein [Photobacterium rosenbergii]|uniref:hypothetical protein n=1 Tax=Photobacterium rosenbergii TaxID=294936 RepID=UPI001C99F8D5|nr:hypothetical protein [Photobacterium rosenbergii]MBY5948460.1 hypothetical protein [Photobacterium rosenbergii]